MLVTSRAVVPRCPICGAPHCSCAGAGDPGAHNPIDFPVEARRYTMADVGRYVDPQGNIWKLTAEQARGLGYKPWTKPAAAATEEAKSTPKPPADKARS